MNPPAHPPAPRDPTVQVAVDEDHLKVLGYIYYVAGGMTAVVSCFFILHFSMFLYFGLHPQMFKNQHNAEPPPTGVFLAFAAVMGCVILLGWTFGALQIYAGRCIRLRRRRIFVMVIAGIECIFVPWGTLIGVFTILLLQRPHVTTLFDRA
jgi:hypothetical protein